MKHAYLILAHNEFGILERLLKALDDTRNDVFIHWDAKLEQFPNLRMQKGVLHVLSNRVDVRWGDRSVVEAEYALLEAATSYDRFEYYHLMSGVDMPLKSQNEIHEFFERNKGKEFIGYSSYAGVEDEIDRKMRWHLFPKHFSKDKAFTLIGILRSLFLKAQKVFWGKKKYALEIRKGTQWISVTDSFALYMLSRKSEVLNLFSHTFCCDEMVAQTLCWNSQFRDKIYDLADEEGGCMRAIGWKNGFLYPWTEADFEKLLTSDKLFARKFSQEHIKVVDEILEYVTEDA